MTSLYNFGSSHSIGWNCSTSYSKILAQQYSADWIDHGHAGCSPEHLLMLMQLHDYRIKQEDIVLIQLSPTPHTSIHIDPRSDIVGHENYRYYFYSYRSMTELDSQQEDDFIYALKAYKTFVNTPEDQWLHYLVYLNSVIARIRELPCRVFAFFDQPLPDLNQAAEPVAQLYNNIITEVESTLNALTLEEFAKALTSCDIYARNSDGSLDAAHYNEDVHAQWANYIDQQIKLKYEKSV